MTAGSSAFDALADEHRRAILTMLRDGDHAVNEIAARLPISRPAVSRHLRVLKAAQLVEEQVAGTRHLYSLREEGVMEIRRYLEQVWGEATSRFRLLAENVQEEQ